MKDKVNNHYFEIFGASIALGVIAGAGEITQGGGTISTSGSQAFTTGTAGSISQSANTLLDRFMQIPPTITIREGHRVKIYFTQDMLLADCILPPDRATFLAPLTQKGNRIMDENQHDEEPIETEELPPLGPGQLRITKEIAGKRVRSLYVSYTDNYNVVEVDFVDGTSLSVELFPMVELKAELNNWKVENGEVLKRWPRMIAR